MLEELFEEVAKEARVGIERCTLLWLEALAGCVLCVWHIREKSKRLIMSSYELSLNFVVTTIPIIEVSLCVSVV